MEKQKLQQFWEDASGLYDEGCETPEDAGCKGDIVIKTWNRAIYECLKIMNGPGLFEDDIDSVEELVYKKQAQQTNS